MIPDNLRSYLYSFYKHFKCGKFSRANSKKTPRKQQDAHVCLYESKTIRDINTKLSEDDNELWPSMLSQFVTYISISTGITSYRAHKKRILMANIYGVEQLSKALSIIDFL